MTAPSVDIAGISLQDRVNFLRIVVHLLHVDHVFTDDERAFANELARGLLLGPEELDDVLDRVNLDEDIHFLAGKLPREMRSQLTSVLTDAAAVDGHIDESEKDLLKHVRIVLQIRATHSTRYDV